MTVVIDGRTRKVRKIVKTTYPGHKKNCNHKMGDNDSNNIWMDRHVEYRRCTKNCGFWKKKTIYFDTDAELDDTMRKYSNNPNY